MRVLVFNGGSSSLKAQLYEIPDGDAPSSPLPAIWEARAGWVRRAGTADIQIRTPEGAREESLAIGGSGDVLPHILQSLPPGVDIAGHRIVHGGGIFSEPALISREVCDEIRRLAEFAPEHHAFELMAIEAAQRFLGPSVPQLAVFDTAFHASLPEHAFVYPGPHSWLAEGVRRFGFHGISHEYTSRRTAQILGRHIRELQMVTCHLGNGASLAAIREGRSVDTTMGFTPLEGLMMGTRSGSIDPGIVTWLIRHHGLSSAELERMLNKESGLKGLSGHSADMREITAAMEAGDDRARLAIDVYVHRLSREIGGMLASLDRLDALVFTGGIGENSALVRERVCARLHIAGVALDPQANNDAPRDAEISVPGSAVRVLVVRTEEEWEIARECYGFILHPESRLKAGCGQDCPTHVS